MRTTVARCAGALLCALALAGCGSDAAADGDNRATPVIAPVASTAAAANAAANASIATADNAAPADAAASCRGVAVAIEPGGLRLIDCSSGRATPLPLGMPGDAAVAALDRAVGARGERTRLEECGAGPMDAVDWPNGLQVRMADGRTIGWSLDRSGPTTMNGVGVGTTRGALEDAYAGVSVEETTLGTELRVGDASGEGPDSSLGGLLDGAGPAARITDLWSGTTCHFT